MRIAVVAQTATPANEAFARVGCHGADWCLMTPSEALATLSPGDAAIGRIDVLPTLDGVDDGIWVLGALAARGVTVLNGAPALLAAHDKLLTARLLRRAGLPHPAHASDHGRRTFVASAAARRRQAAVRQLGPRRRAVRRRGGARRAAGGVAARAVVPGPRGPRAGSRAAARIRSADRRCARPRGRGDQPGRGPGRMENECRARRRAPGRDASAGGLRPRAGRGAGDGRGSGRGRPPPGRVRPLDRGRDQRRGRVHAASTPSGPAPIRSRRPPSGSPAPRSAPGSASLRTRRRRSASDTSRPGRPLFESRC